MCLIGYSSVDIFVKPVSKEVYEARVFWARDILAVIVFITDGEALASGWISAKVCPRSKV